MVERWAKNTTRNQARVAATDPHVPGPGFPNPAPKNVAAVQAHSVLLVFIVRAPGLQSFQVFQHFRIKHRRRNAISAACPLSQINLPAAVATEGKILATSGYKCAAGGASQNRIFL